MSTARELAALVREALASAITYSRSLTTEGTPEKYPATELRGLTILQAQDLLVALDALVAECERLYQRAVDAETQADVQGEMAEAAERERDELKDEARKNFDWAKAERSGRKEERTRADAAEARARRYEEALREIVEAKSYVVDMPDGHPSIIVRTADEAIEEAIERARAALTEEQNTVGGGQAGC